MSMERFKYKMSMWLAAGLVVGAVEAQMTQTIRDFEVPEFDRDNRLRSHLFGETARILPDGLVDITNMLVFFYDDNQQVEMRVTAEACIYDRATKNAHSESRVRLARENAIITGKGFVWTAADSKIEIHDEARVVLVDTTRIIEQEE
jgi:lipopolysaccharide export system protein LptC